ncbi:hypothetical protein JXE04_02150 [Patescibacteria group bacterium]|nr:hypothetical protein [Patescibacteria group bacterium]
MKIKKNKTSVAARPNLSQNPKILEVNLIKNEMRVDFDWNQHLSTLLFSVIVTALFVAEIYFGLNWWAEYENNRVIASELKYRQVSTDIVTLRTESDQILAFKEKVDAASSLLDNHIYWTNFLDWLEKNTLSTVTYSGFSGKSDGIYDLTASANTFREVSWQTRAFLADSSVISVNVNEASMQAGDDVTEDAGIAKVNFNLSLKVDPKLFKANLK